jgi:hypothetical protein
MAPAEAGAWVNGSFFPFVLEDDTPIPRAVVVPGMAPSGESKRWRRLGALGGAAGGFFAYMPVALGDSRVGVSDGQRLLEWSAVTAGAAIVGYLIGRKLDRR